MSGSPSNEQRHFRVRIDGKAVDSTPTWGAAEDANFWPGYDAPFRVRFAVSNVGTGTAGNFASYYELNNSGTWVLITTTSSVVRGVDASSNGALASNTPSTANFRLTAGSGTAVNGRYTETGTIGGSCAAASHSEYEYGYQFLDADIAPGDVIKIRIQATAVFATYTNIPTFTAPAADSAPSGPTAYQLSDTASDLTGETVNKRLETTGAAGSWSGQNLDKNDTGLTSIVDGSFFTLSGVPGTSGNSSAGKYADVSLDITTGNSLLRYSVRLIRVNSSGVVQAYGPLSAETTAGTSAIYTFQASFNGLGTWVSGDRLRLDVRIRNSSTTSGQSATLTYASSNSGISAQLAAAETNASASQTTSLPTQTANATVRVSASATQTTSAPTQTASLVTLVAVNASAAQTTALPSQTANAAVRVSTSASQTTVLPSQTANTAVRVSASATQTTALPAQTTNAGVRVTLTATQSTDLPTQTATASLVLAELNASAAQTTDLPIQTASATVRVSASATQTTALPSQTANAAVRVSASATQTTALPVQTAAVGEQVTATASQTTDFPVQTAALVTTETNRAVLSWIEFEWTSDEVSAAAAQTTDLPSQTAALGVRVGLTATQTTALPAQTANLGARVGLSAAQTTALPVQTVNAGVRVTLTATQSTDLPAQTAAASLVLTGLNASAAQTTDLPVQTASATVRVSASASQTTSLPAQTANAGLVVKITAGDVEALANSGFDNTSAWTLTNASISGGVLNVTSGARFLVQTGVFTIGETYNYSLQWNSSAGVNLRIGNSPTTNAADIVVAPFPRGSGPQSKQGSFVAVNTAFALEADTATFSGTVDNVRAWKAGGQITSLPSQTANAGARVGLTATQTTALPTQTASLKPRVSLSATQTTALPTQAAEVKAAVRLTATQATALPAQTATSTIPAGAAVNATAAQTTALPTQTATVAAVLSIWTETQAAFQDDAFQTDAFQTVGELTQFTARPIQTAALKLHVSLSATQTTALPSQTATVAAQVALSALQTTALPAQTAEATVDAVVITGGPEITLRGSAQLVGALEGSVQLSGSIRGDAVAAKTLEGAVQLSGSIRGDAAAVKRLEGSF
jgi:hypothetical protein